MGGRVDLNDLLTSNEELLSLLLHNTNVVSGPVIESALVKKKRKKNDLGINDERVQNWPHCI